MARRVQRPAARRATRATRGCVGPRSDPCAGPIIPGLPQHLGTTDVRLAFYFPADAKNRSSHACAIILLDRCDRYCDGNHCSAVRLPCGPRAPSVIAATSDRVALGLTIYAYGEDRGYGFIREERRVPIPAGHFVLSAPDIASSLVPETTRFELVSVDADGRAQTAAELYEQRYEYDRLSPRRLLEKSEGQRITATSWRGGRSGHEQSLTGVVVASQKGTLVRTDSGEVVSVDGAERIALGGIPPGLVNRPTLSWSVGAYEPANAILRLSYRADGFSWHADYVVQLDRSRRTADVEGWVTVSNFGDTSFDRVKLQLAAGTVHTTQPPGRPVGQAAMSLNAALLERAPAHATQETLGDIHLYAVEHLTDLPPRSTKQVRFVVERGVRCNLEAESQASLQTATVPAGLVVKLDHPHSGAFGVPLPAGHARTSFPSSAGTQVQVGQGAVEHSPAGEPWRVPVAQDANQITRVVVQNERRLGRDRDGAALRRVTLRIEIRDASTDPMRRRVVIAAGA